MARGKRGRRARSEAIVRDIQATAEARQDAWVRGERNSAARLTVDLNGPEHVLRPEGLFAQQRYERRGEDNAANRPPIPRELGYQGPLP
jgi:hypothetical protein